MCFVSYTIGKMNAEMNHLMEKGKQSDLIPLHEDGIKTKEAIPIKVIKPHPAIREPVYLNSTNIRPVIQMNKEVYHINDHL